MTLGANTKSALLGVKFFELGILKINLISRLNRILIVKIYFRALHENIRLVKIIFKPDDKGTSLFDVKGSQDTIYRVAIGCLPSCSCPGEQYEQVSML